MKITRSQRKAVDLLVTEENVIIKSIQSCEFSSRIRVFVISGTFLSYNLYIGKRGKTFETESGDF